MRLQLQISVIFREYLLFLHDAPGILLPDDIEFDLQAWEMFSEHHLPFYWNRSDFFEWFESLSSVRLVKPKLKIRAYSFRNDQSIPGSN